MFGCSNFIFTAIIFTLKKEEEKNTKWRLLALEYSNDVKIGIEKELVKRYLIINMKKRDQIQNLERAARCDEWGEI